MHVDVADVEMPRAESGQPRKRSHDLFDLAGPTAFLESLSRNGINLPEFVNQKLVPGCEPPGILLVGSLAEALGNGESDIDILILVEHEADVRRDADSLRLSTGQSSELLEYRNGLEFNFEFVARERQTRLLNDFLALAPALCDASKVERFSLIERFDLRFMHRLRTGWAVGGGDIVDRWRDEFLVDLLPNYLSIRHFFEYLELLEDLNSLQRLHPTSVPHVARQCAEALLAALLASEGWTSQSRKWFIRSSEKLEGRAAALAGTAIRLMFPDRLMDAAQIDRHIAEIEALGAGVEEFLAGNPESATGLLFLRKTISYAAPAGGPDA